MSDDAPGDKEPLDELAILADELLEQAVEVRRQWQELSAVLSVEPEAPVEDVAPGHAAGAIAEPDPVRPAPAPPAPEAATADPLRLVALDMMLSGRSREEVEEYLAATFGEDVDASVLDDVFSADAS